METSGCPREGSSELGEGTCDNSALPSRRGMTHHCALVVLSFIIILFKDKGHWGLEESLENKLVKSRIYWIVVYIYRRYCVI